MREEIAVTLLTGLMGACLALLTEKVMRRWK